MLQTWVFLSIQGVSTTRFVQSFIALISHSSSWDPVGKDRRGTLQMALSAAVAGCCSPSSQQLSGKQSRRYSTPLTHTCPVRSRRSETGSTLLAIILQVRMTKETKFVEHWGATSDTEVHRTQSCQKKMLMGQRWEEREGMRGKYK